MTMCKLPAASDEETAACRASGARIQGPWRVYPFASPPRGPPDGRGARIGDNLFGKTVVEGILAHWRTADASGERYLARPEFVQPMSHALAESVTVGPKIHRAP